MALTFLKTRLPVFRMLQLEEALFRNKDSGNFCIFNHFTASDKDSVTHHNLTHTDSKLYSSSTVEALADRNVVIGIGQEKQLSGLIDVNYAKKSTIPIIKRFTGGGTVLVDSSTFFVSFIFNKSEFSQNLKPEFRDVDVKNIYPREIMRWTEAFYRHFFSSIEQLGTERSSEHPLDSSSLSLKVKEKDLVQSFKLEDTDYVFGKRKFGGNAQAISGERWCHHTSFLWDFDKEFMKAALRNPKKQPEYREKREHEDFLIRLKEVFQLSQDHSSMTDQTSQIQAFSCALEASLDGMFTSVNTMEDVKQVEELMKVNTSQSHRKKTTYVEL